MVQQERPFFMQVHTAPAFPLAPLPPLLSSLLYKACHACRCLDILHVTVICPLPDTARKGAALLLLHSMDSL